MEKLPYVELYDSGFGLHFYETNKISSLGGNEIIIFCLIEKASILSYDVCGVFI